MAAPWAEPLWTAGKAALAQVEQAYAAYTRERDKRVGAVAQKMQALEKAWMDAREAADTLARSTIAAWAASRP